MVKKILMLLLVASVFLGCKEMGLNLKVRYDQIQGLKEGDRVIFEQNHVGQVAGIFYSEEGYYLVDVIIRKDFANAATDYSKFIITWYSSTRLVNIPIISSALIGSSDAVGSSAMTTEGSCAMALAMATLCRSPTDNWPGSFSR